MGQDDAVARGSSSSLLVPADQPKQIAGADRFGAAQIVLDLAELDPSRKDVARAEIPKRSCPTTTAGH